jgi:hypothetical protein
MTDPDWLTALVLEPPQKSRTRLGDIFAAPPAPALTAISRTGLGDIFAPPPAPEPSFLGSLLIPAPSSPTALSGNALSVLARPASIKRKAYFAFDFEDLFRVNNVRQAWKIDHPDSALMRSFYDRSIWESRKIKDENTLKNLMRNAVQYSSAVCVLVGTETWRSRWVKYEIARAVIDHRGLLAVHINGLNHVKRRMPDPLGYNPLHVMGVYRSPDNKYYLYEKVVVVVNPATGELGWEWRQYEDYTDPVQLPQYISRVPAGYVIPLSAYTAEHDYVQEGGHKNIGAWIDAAAIQVGR